MPCEVCSEVMVLPCAQYTANKNADSHSTVSDFVTCCTCKGRTMQDCLVSTARFPHDPAVQTCRSHNQHPISAVHHAIIPATCATACSCICPASSSHSLRPWWQKPSYLVCHKVHLGLVHQCVGRHCCTVLCAEQQQALPIRGHHCVVHTRVDAMQGHNLAHGQRSQVRMHERMKGGSAPGKSRVSACLCPP